MRKAVRRGYSGKVRYKIFDLCRTLPGKEIPDFLPNTKRRREEKTACVPKKVT